MANRKKTGRRSRSNIGFIIAAVVICCAAAAVTLANRRQEGTGGVNQQQEGTGGADQQQEDTGDVKVIAEGESLIIPISDVSSVASFYPVEVDGTRMEVLAVTDSEGNIRTAFNTCQICYSSGRGYYVQNGNVLICQNCGNQFTVDQVEILSGGCNPWPIFPEDKTVTDDAIEISYDYLAASKAIFENWKAQ